MISNGQSTRVYLVILIAVTIASCTNQNPSTNVRDEIVLLESMASTVDTFVVHRLMQSRSAAIEKSGSSPLYEYYVVGRLPESELEFHLSPTAIGALARMGENVAAIQTLRSELANRGYQRGATKAEEIDVLNMGKSLKLHRVHESYQRTTSLDTIDFWIETLQDDGDVLDLSFGATTPRLGRPLLPQNGATIVKTITVGDSHLLWDSVSVDTIEFSELVKIFGGYNRMFPYSTSESKVMEAFKKSLRLPKAIDRSDCYVFDTLGLRVKVNRETRRLSSLVVHMKASNLGDAPRKPFTGDLIVNGRTVNSQTLIVDLLNQGIGYSKSGILAPTFLETSNGSFQLKFDFDYGIISATKNGTTFTGDGSLKEVEIQVLRNNALVIHPRADQP